MLFDSHCHLQFKAFEKDLNDAIKRCKEKNVVLNIVGTQKETSKRAVELAQKHDNMYATVGLHPTHLFETRIVEEETEFISREEDFDEEFYSELIKSPKVVAIGETGLDVFHLPKDKTKEEVLKRQKEVFIKQINFAIKNNLVTVIHCRDAYSELVNILKSEIHNLKSEIRAVVHCFSSSWKYAKILLDMGLHLGFTGVITFPPKKTNQQEQLDLLEVVKKTPLDKMLVETDAPFLAPQRYRGKRCEPWMVEEVVAKIAEIKHISFEKVNKQINKNFHEFFRTT